MLNDTTSSETFEEALMGRDTIQMQQDMIPDYQVIDDALQIRIRARPVYQVVLPPSPYLPGLGFGQNQAAVQISIKDPYILKTSQICRTNQDYIIIDQKEEQAMHNKEVELLINRINQEFTKSTPKIRQNVQDLKQKKDGVEHLPLSFFEKLGQELEAICTSQILHRSLDDFIDTISINYLKMVFGFQVCKHDLKIFSQLIYPKEKKIDKEIYTVFVLRDCFDKYYKGDQQFLFLNLENLKATEDRACREIFEHGFQQGVGIEYLKGGQNIQEYLCSLQTKRHKFSYLTFLDLESSKLTISNLFTGFQFEGSAMETIRKLSLKNAYLDANVIKAISELLIAKGNLVDIDLSGIKVSENPKGNDIPAKLLKVETQSAAYSTLTCAQAIQDGYFFGACFTAAFCKNYVFGSCFADQMADYTLLQKKLQDLQKTNNIDLTKEVQKVHKARELYWLEFIVQALQKRAKSNKVFDYFFFNDVNIGNSQSSQGLLKALGECQVISCSLNNCNLGTNQQLPLIDLIRLSSRLVYLNYEGNFLNQAGLLQVASFARVSPRWLAFEYNIVGLKTKGEDIIVETNTYKINKEEGQFGGLGCCFGIEVLDVEQNSSAKNYKAFRSVEEYEHSNFISDEYNLKGAQKLLNNIQEELHEHHAQSLRRIFTYGKGYENKLEELLVLKKLTKSEKHPLFQQMRNSYSHNQSISTLLSRVIEGQKSEIETIEKLIQAKMDERLNPQEF